MTTAALPTLSTLLAALPRVVRSSRQAECALGRLTELADTTLVVARGALALAYAEPRSGGRLLHIFGPEDYLNVHDASVLLYTNHCMVITLAPTVVLEVATSAFERYRSSDSRVAAAVAAAEAAQRETLLRRLAALSLREPPSRLAATLVGLTERIGERCRLADGRYLKMPQHLIASAAHLSRQRTNLLLRRFRRARLVCMAPGFLCAVDVDGLRAVAAGRPLPRASGPPLECKRRHPAAALTCRTGAG